MKTLLCNAFIKSCRVEDSIGLEKYEGPRLFIPNLPKKGNRTLLMFLIYINIWISSPFGPCGKTISNNIPLLMGPRSKSKFCFSSAKPFREACFQPQRTKEIRHSTLEKLVTSRKSPIGTAPGQLSSVEF